MLRITVELIPGGDEARCRELARAQLGNISDLADTSDYEIIAGEGENKWAGAMPWVASGLIDGHDRRQTVWALVEKAAAWAMWEACRASGVPFVATPAAMPQSVVDWVRDIAEAVMLACDKCGAPGADNWKFCPMCGSGR